MPNFTCTAQFENALDNEPVWVHVCSLGSAGHHTQRTSTTNGTVTLNLEDVNGATTDHTLLAFTRGRKPIWFKLEPPGGAHSIQFEPEVELPVVIWILHGDFDQQKLRALNAILITNTILFEERTGLRIVANEIIDATGAASSIRSPLVSEKDWVGFSEIRKDIFKLENCLNETESPSNLFRPGIINLFFINHIDDTWDVHGRRVFGDDDFTTAIAFSRHALDDLLIHELGHALGLGHTLRSDDGFEVPRKQKGLFNPRNIMVENSRLRRHITEGQVIAMHFSPDSAIADVYNLDDPLGTRLWYKKAHDAEALSFEFDSPLNPPMIMMPTIDPSKGGSGTAPSTDDVMMTAKIILCNPEQIAEHVAASCERYDRRQQQLMGNHGITDQATVSQLQAVTKEQYVASDLIRILDFYLTRLTENMPGFPKARA